MQPSRWLSVTPWPFEREMPTRSLKMVWKCLQLHHICMCIACHWLVFINKPMSGHFLSHIRNCSASVNEKIEHTDYLKSHIFVHTLNWIIITWPHSLIKPFTGLEDKRPFGRFLLAGLRVCGYLDFWICVYGLLGLSKKTAPRGAKKNFNS